MIGLGSDQLTDEEIWLIIQYERSFSGQQDHGMMVQVEGMGPMMGPGGGMGEMERRGPKGGMSGCEGEACDR